MRIAGERVEFFPNGYHLILCHQLVGQEGIGNIIKGEWTHTQRDRQGGSAESGCRPYRIFRADVMSSLSNTSSAYGFAVALLFQDAQRPGRLHEFLTQVTGHHVVDSNGEGGIHLF